MVKGQLFRKDPVKPQRGGKKKKKAGFQKMCKCFPCCLGSNIHKALFSLVCQGRSEDACLLTHFPPCYGESMMPEQIRLLWQGLSAESDYRRGIILKSVGGFMEMVSKGYCTSKNRPTHTGQLYCRRVLSAQSIFTFPLYQKQLVSLAIQDGVLFDELRNKELGGCPYILSRCLSWGCCRNCSKLE